MIIQEARNHRRDIHLLNTKEGLSSGKDQPCCMAHLKQIATKNISHSQVQTSQWYSVTVPCRASSIGRDP